MRTVLEWMTRVPVSVVFLLCAGLVIVGLPLLVDWSRKRRRQTTDRQIALTDAIYARFGSIAAPVVRDPFWGRRKIQFAVRPGAASKALVAAHEVLAVADRMKLGRYEIVLTPEPALGRAAQTFDASALVEHRVADRKAAA